MIPSSTGLLVKTLINAPIYSEHAERLLILLLWDFDSLDLSSDFEGDFYLCHA